jgi:UDP-N-acetylglucosamine 2-epimerase
VSPTSSSAAKATAGGTIDAVSRQPTIAVVLGIRPDVIRASLVLNALRAQPDVDVRFIWSGQHYSDNLKDVFFRELDVAPPDIVHIEGCMRSYDWRMPEEKYRTTIDHLSDVIYAYFDEYKANGVAEGLNPDRICVVQNLIVDVLDEYYFRRKDRYDELASAAFFSERSLEQGRYYLMTCHRRESVVEEAAVLGVASVQMRRATERPQVYDAGASVKFDPAAPEDYPPARVLEKLATISGTTWEHGLGDGKASQRIVHDLVRRAQEDDFRGHRPEQYHLDVSRSYRGDGLD